MDYGIKRLIIILFSLLAIIATSGCANSNNYAPVVDVWQQPQTANSYYKVQPGDTIYSIAWAFDIDYRDLAKFNNLSSPYKIEVGQRLRMTAPSKSGPKPEYKTKSKPTKEAKSSHTTKKVSTPTPSHHAYSKPKPQLSHKTTTHHKRVPKAPPLPKHWLWPAHGKVVSRYAPHPGGNKGIDISGKFGEPVLASAGGTVVYSGSGLPAYGKLIIIKHSASYLSAYAHNAKLLVKEGQIVQAGQAIAAMGRTNGGQVELHFEIRRNGKPVNPLRYLG
ncbi:MAG: peptidoglycan DD-metalloendopeptidase family protein [Gammaproteobacteria bacterium]|nr:peptidoglycan DD-metalloendopeptidase family protein [Gammaproteobacteria bacterium]